MNPTGPRRILLGLTGGIAAYKAAELTRLLIKDGHDVRVVMSEAACRFVEQGGRHAAITKLDQIIEAVDGSAGTVVVPDTGG